MRARLPAPLRALTPTSWLIVGCCLAAIALAAFTLATGNPYG